MANGLVYVVVALITKLTSCAAVSTFKLLASKKSPTAITTALDTSTKPEATAPKNFTVPIVEAPPPPLPECLRLISMFDPSLATRANAVLAADCVGMEVL